MSERFGNNTTIDLQDGDFVWVYMNDTDTIEWGIVIDGKIIYQSGGFDELDAFDGRYQMFKDGYEAYIGHGVRNANSFCSAKFFYDWVAHGKTDRYLDHHTNMEIINSGDEFVDDCDMKIYRVIDDEGMKLTIRDLRLMFNRDVVIVDNND